MLGSTCEVQWVLDEENVVVGCVKAEVGIKIVDRMRKCHCAVCFKDLLLRGGTKEKAAQWAEESYSRGGYRIQSSGRENAYIWVEEVCSEKVTIDVGHTVIADASKDTMIQSGSETRR